METDIFDFNPTKKVKGNMVVVSVFDKDQEAQIYEVPAKAVDLLHAAARSHFILSAMQRPDNKRISRLNSAFFSAVDSEDLVQLAGKLNIPQGATRALLTAFALQALAEARTYQYSLLERPFNG